MSFDSISYKDVLPGQDEFVSQHAQLVRRIAFTLHAKLPFAVHIDDLIQAGMTGLIKARERWKPSAGASFETYAGIRIRGAMIDNMRQNLWCPRSVVRKNREIQNAVSILEQRNGYSPSYIETANYLNITVDELDNRLNAYSSSVLVSVDTHEDDTAERLLPKLGCTAESDIDRAAVKNAVKVFISGLNEREQYVMNRRLRDSATLGAIASELNVTESRVCQIVNEVSARLIRRVRRDLDFR